MIQAKAAAARPLLSPASLAGAAHLYLCVVYHLLNEHEAVRGYA